jgi:hypothetical protein
MLVLMEKLFKLIYTFAVSIRLYTLLSFVYSYVIEELTVDGATIRPSKHAKNNKYTILILSSKAFRKDIECIVATNEFRVLRLPDHWQSRLIFQFYPEKFQKFWVDTNPDYPDSKYKKEQKELREFLQKFLKKLYKKIRVDCVISPHHKYVVDMDWGSVSTKMGVPHIMLPRDSQYASSHATLDKMMFQFKNALPRFEGEHIIVQSEYDIPLYVESGYCKKNEISSLGCPRMDSFVKKTKKKKDHSENMRKKVVFLPFNWGMHFEKSDLFSYICDVHLFFVHFALRHPEIDIVIKSKPKQPRSPKKTVLLEPLKGSSIEIEKIPNLTIRDDLDLHDLFFETDVVCGLQTSALIEAAVIGLPVIIPYFKDVQNHKYDERLFYRDSFDLFDIAKDVNELESLILKRLHNQTIDKKIVEGRKALFEGFVSSLDGDATEKYVAMIKRVIVEKLSGQPVQRQ